jgi:hypothetical protein
MLSAPLISGVIIAAKSRAVTYTPVQISGATSYHTERNHQGVENRLIQMPTAVAADHGAIRCHARLGGTLNFYYRKAA